MLDPDQLIGEVIDSRYRVEEYLGRGAMGLVFRATHVRFPQQYAIKLLKQVDEHVSTQRFEREARLAGKLSHPNTISVIDSGEIDGVSFLVMDLAPGVPLRTLMVGRPFSTDRATRILGQLCDGLEHAHGRGVIHRDLKPDNIIIDGAGTYDEIARIVDFGIAIPIDSTDDPNSRLTHGDVIFGTPQFVAPEIAMGKPFDHRVDLFALGVILYELVCGERPFDGDGVELLSRNTFTDAPPMATRAPRVAVDPHLESVSRRLMARAPNDRPASAFDARAELERRSTSSP